MKCDNLVKYEMYRVADVDEAIAELKDKCLKNTIAVSEAYDFLESENAQLKESIAVYQRNEKADIRELRHQKYKRCLAMAMYCYELVEHYRAEYDAEEGFGDGWLKWIRWAKKWHKRWLELAEKFKEPVR